MPALLTSTSIGWPDARNAWAARRTEPRSETSRDTHWARAAGKRLWSALRTGLVRSSERVASTTRPPRAARASTRARPIPEFAPVTKNVRPRRSPALTGYPSVAATSTASPAADRVMFGIPFLHDLHHALDVITHALHGEGRVAPLQRVENTEVLLVVPLARGHDGEDEALLGREQLPQDVEGLQHDDVPRRDGDLAVELHVHPVEHVVVVEVLLRRGEQPSQFLQVRGRGVPDRGRDRPDLERLAGTQQIEQQPLGERPRVVRARQHQHLVGAVHVYAGPVADRHQPDGLEALEGFAHRRVPDA